MKLATLCYIRRNHQTLMLHRNKKPNDMHEGKWNGLGGKFETGESPEDCIIREVFEESGLIIKNPKLHGFITFPSFDQKDDWYVFIYTCNHFEGELIDSAEGHLEWIDNHKIPDLPLWEGDRIFLKWIDEHEDFFSAKFNYNDSKLEDYSVVFH